MFRKILSAVFALFMFVPFAHSAEMVNEPRIEKSPGCGEYEISVDGCRYSECIFKR